MRMYVRVNVHVYVRVNVHVYVRVDVRMCVGVDVCVCVCEWMCAFIWLTPMLEDRWECPDECSIHELGDDQTRYAKQVYKEQSHITWK